jgi:hypothetical protein
MDSSFGISTTSWYDENYKALKSFAIPVVVI